MPQKSKTFNYTIYKKILNILTVLFSILLLADMYLAPQASKEKIEYRLYQLQETGHLRSRDTESVHGMQTNKNAYVLIDSQFYATFKEGDSVLLHKTKLFGEVDAINYKNTTYEHVAYTIYRYYALFPIICIVSSFGAFLLGRFEIPLYNYALILSALTSIYLIISIVTNNIM